MEPPYSLHAILYCINILKLVAQGCAVSCHRSFFYERLFLSLKFMIVPFYEKDRKVAMKRDFPSVQGLPTITEFESKCIRLLSVMKDYCTYPVRNCAKLVKTLCWSRYLITPNMLILDGNYSCSVYSMA